MKTTLFIVSLVSIALSGCRTLPSPITLAPSAFDESPAIIQRNDRFYVRYRLSPERMGVRSYAIVQKEKDRAFIYFSTPVSFPEWGQLHEIPLRPHDAEEFARNGQFYLRDAEGKDHKLEIRNEN